MADKVAGNVYEHQNSHHIIYKRAALFASILVLFYLSRTNYILFHSVAEIITIYIGCTITLIAYITYSQEMNSSMIFIGIAYGFISLLDFIHTLTFTGLNIFPNIDSDPAVQLWLSARLLEAVSILVMILTYQNVRSYRRVILTYSMITILLLLSIFAWDLFPASYIEGRGLTPFKQFGEFVISLLLASSLYFARKKLKGRIGPKTYCYFTYSIIATILSEFCFIFYDDIIFNYFNTLGHFLKLISFYFIYKAVIEVQYRKPYLNLSAANERLVNEIIKKNEAEAQLQEKELTLQSILSSLDEGILVVNKECGIVYYNQIFVDLLGIPSSQLAKNRTIRIKEHLSGLMENMQLEDLYHNVYQSLEQGEESELDFSLTDGRQIKCFIRPFRSNDLKGWVFCLRDITSRKTYENLLLESKKNYKLLLDHIPDAIIVEEDMRCMYANCTAARLFGYENPKDMIGEDLCQYLTDDSKERYEQRKAMCKEGSMQSQPIELEIQGQEGGKWVILDTHYYTQHGDNLNLTIIRDITEEKLNRDLRQRIRVREETMEKRRLHEQLSMEFYSNLSHELKTPINVISAVGQMLKKEVKDYSPRVDSYIEMLENNCRRLIKIVNESIDIDKLEKGYLKMDIQNYNIVDIIEDITQSVIPYAEKKDVEVIFDTNVEECVMRMDINLMERILLNLLSNAIKFTPPGGNILVTMQAEDHEIEIGVQDTGIGIEEDELAYIFERYNRGNHSDGLNPMGSGIGLYLVKRFVELLGGRITAYSEKGKGSIFKVILPRRDISQGDMVIDIKNLTLRKLGTKERVNTELSDLENCQGRM